MIFEQPSLNVLKSVDKNILKLSYNNLINMLLYGDQFKSNKNLRLLNTTITYIIDSGRHEEK